MASIEKLLADSYERGYRSVTILSRGYQDTYEYAEGDQEWVLVEEHDIEPLEASPTPFSDVLRHEGERG